MILGGVSVSIVRFYRSDPKPESRIMYREGHLGLALLFYSPMAYYLFNGGQTTVFGLGLLGVALWSYAPDFDLVLPLPHRGPTHTVTAAVAAAVLTAFLSFYIAKGEVIVLTDVFRYPYPFVTGFLIGFLGVTSHLIGDFLTPAGIRPWWPFSGRNYSLGLLGAENKLANQVLSFVGGCSVLTAVLLSSI